MQIYDSKCYLTALLITIPVIAGCGTLSNGGKQTIFVQTIANNKVVDAKCTLTNSAGVWSAISSSDVELDKCAGDLTIECKSVDNSYFGKEIVTSKTSSSMWASIVTVGVVATVDAVSSAGYDYPSNIIVIMKKYKTEEIETND